MVNKLHLLLVQIQALRQKILGATVVPFTDYLLSNNSLIILSLATDKTETKNENAFLSPEQEAVRKESRL